MITVGAYVMFQFPSNGKAYPKIPESGDLELITRVFVFQFPSNGKAYPKREKPVEVEDVRKKFQFPSNGKAYPKFM